MTDDEIPAFTVRFGKTARTIDYTDGIGILVFTFDVSGKNPGARLVLEHWAKTTPRDMRYPTAFKCTKEFLESCGYVVEIWGE